MKKILYPIFLKLSCKMQDNFWRYVYEDLAYGRAPYGLYLQDDYLCCYIKNKEFSYKITDNESTLNELHDLLKKKAGILSEKDKIEDRDSLLNEKLTKIKSIHKKTYRDTLIQNYIIREGKLYNIDIECLRKLLKFLNNGFLFKIISLQDLCFTTDQNMIESIRGIVFEKNRIKINHDLFSNIHNVSIEEEEIKKQNVIQIWKNFVEEQSIIIA